MADIDEQNARILSLSPEKRRLLLKLLKNQGVDISQLPILPRDPGTSVLPLSYAQDRLWFLDQLDPGTAVYNIPVGLRFKGQLDVTALRDSLSEIVRRHEVLRTRFAMFEGKPCHIIEAAVSMELPVVDLSALPESEREIEGKRLVADEAQKPFNLANGPVFRARLIRMSAEDHVFVLAMHHIVSDGWSIAILIRELKILYQAFVTGQASPLPELPIQYADYALWQRDYLQGTVLDDQVKYWKKQLADAPAFLELPADRPRPAIQSSRGALLMFELPKPLLKRLTELSRREGASLFMTLLAGFQALLYRYTGQEDVVVGSAIAGRNRAEVENLIGFFVNALVLRGDLSGKPTFRVLLGRTREAALGAYAHQSLPFEKMVEVLRPERDTSRSPLFQVMLVLHNTPDEAANLKGLKATSILADSGTAKFDLTLYINETNDSAKVTAEYNTDLFEAARIERLVGHYQRLLEEIVADPDKPVAEMSIMTDSERQEVLVDWNQTEAYYPKNRCLHELVEDQVARTPEAVAVVFEDEELTYGELNERADRVAGYLQSLGVGPGAMVGILVDRSLDMIIGLLGILKAGGAYVPMDPSYPKERVAFMIEDSKPKALLTHRRWLQFLPEPGTQVVLLDGDLPKPVAQAGVAEKPTAESAAYVIFTSGSTGKPKGVQIPHRAVVNFLQSMQQKLGFSSEEVLLAVTTLSFDIAGLEIFLPLTTGARIALVSREVATDGHRLSAELLRRSATIMQATPATWRLLLEAGWKGNAQFKILCGGEAWSTELGNELLKRCGSLWNMYGPTETTIWSAVSKVRPGEPVLIGGPIANTQFYILDAAMQPVPVGVPGELWIGGDGLAIGYLNRPELSAERFVADPFSKKPGARLYRTGDAVRLRGDRQIEFLNRIDNQIKIRGYRIELGEIEAQLAAHPNVKEAVVMAREDNPGDKRLVAYLTAKNGELPKAMDLRALLQTKLPDYMVPSAFVTLERFPLTPNGKLDRKAFPKPDHESKPGTFDPPRTPREIALAKIWCEVLGVKQIGRHDNFFDLGGHSLLVVQLQARMKKELEKNVPLTAFFQAPTVAEMDKILTEPGAAENRAHALVPASTGSGPAVFFFHFFNPAKNLVKHLLPGQPAYVIESNYEEELRLWQEKKENKLTLEQLASRSLADMRRVQPQGPYHLAGFCFGGVLAFAVANQLAEEGEKVASLSLLDAFYRPGIIECSTSLASRWIFHAKKLLKYRTDYLSMKIRERFGSREHNSPLFQSNQAGGEVRWKAEMEETRLLHDDYMNELGRAYHAKPYHGKAILIRAIGAPHTFNYSSSNGWSKVLTDDFRVENILSDHFTFLEEPFVNEVAKKLQDFITSSGDEKSALKF
jgi:amino acid adenylation domain-containing protein